MEDLELRGWIRTGPFSYRHYCGARISRHGKGWVARLVNGSSSPRFPSAIEASAFLLSSDPDFWTYGKPISIQWKGEVRLNSGYLDKNEVDHAFVCYLPKRHEFPEYLSPAFKKYFFDRAACAKCARPMGRLETRLLTEFDESRSYKHTYIVCTCGYPVWKLDLDSFFKAESLLYRAEAGGRRLRQLKQWGGKHSAGEIQEILKLQNGKCIYCDRRFTPKRLRPTRDHLCSVSRGGTDWSLNIVMACRQCNSRRCDIPFRTYCKLLSPKQNRKILYNLRRRLLTLDFDTLTDDAWTSFSLGLAIHDSRNFRFREIQSASSVARRNAARNKLLPRTASLILKRASSQTKARKS